MRRNISSPLSIIIIFVLLIVISVLNAFSLYSQSIRLDEAQSIWISTKPVLAILKLTALDVHVPLYGLILHFWLQIFGTELTIARTLSFIFYVLTLPVLYLLAKESSSQKTAVLVVILFSFSPFVMWFSNEVRMYTFFALIASLNHLFFLRSIRSEGSKGKAGYFITILIGFYTHYFFNFLLLTQIIYIFFLLLKHRKVPLFLFKLMGGAFLFFAPWLIYVLSLGGASNTQPLIPKPTSYNIFQTLILFVFGFQNQTLQGFLVSLWPLLVMVLFFVFTRRRLVESFFVEYFIMATFIPLVVVFGISLIRSIFLARYLIFVIPTLFYLIALLFTYNPKKLPVLIIAVFLMIMAGFLVYQNTSASTPVREDYKETARYLVKNVNPQDIVAVTPHFTIYPIEYYYNGRARIVTIPEWNRFIQGPTPNFSLDKLKSQLKIYKSTYSMLFVVFSYDQGYEEKIKRYLDSNFERKEVKKFSSNIEVRVYRLRYDIP